MLPQVGNQLIPSTLTTTATAGNDAIVMNLFDKLQLAGYTYHILSSFCFLGGFFQLCWKRKTMVELFKLLAV